MSPERWPAMLGCLCGVLAASPTAHAQLGPPASYVSAGCGWGNGTYTDRGPAGSGLQIACDQHEVGVDTRYGPYDFLAASSVNTGLESGGAVDANASLTMTGGNPYTTWGAGAGGWVRYMVGLSGLAETPPQHVPSIPVRFFASGEAHVTDGDGGSFDISAWLDSVGYQRKWEGVGSQSGAFSNSATVWLSTAPNSAGQVLISAWCHVSTWSGGAGSGSCAAAADPSFSFDQAAFDASMGGDTFPLDRYFRIDLSPGVTPVPEPTAWLSLTAGLLALAATLRRGPPRWARAGAKGGAASPA